MKYEYANRPALCQSTFSHTHRLIVIHIKYYTLWLSLVMVSRPTSGGHFVVIFIVEMNLL